VHIGVLTVLVAVFLCAPVSAQIMQRSGPVCGERGSLMDQLKHKYSEQPKSMGLAANGSVLEVLTAPTGTWTILLTTPQGITCLIAAGENWEDMEQDTLPGGGVFAVMILMKYGVV